MVNSSEDSYAMRLFELTQKPSKLDYVFLHDDSIIDELQHLQPIGSSDHVGLLWGLRSDLSYQAEAALPKKAFWRGDCKNGKYAHVY